MMPTDLIALVEHHVRITMEHVVEPDLRIAHDFLHVDRVRRWALHLAQLEHFPDLELLEVTALLHDIGLACDPRT